MVEAPTPLVVCEPWLGRARALWPRIHFLGVEQMGRQVLAEHLEWTRSTLTELLTLATATKVAPRDELHHYHSQWDFRLREFMSRRWPRPRFRHEGERFWGRLTNVENSLCGRGAQRAKEQGLAGLVWALQAWNDHVVRTLLAAMHHEFVQIQNASPRGAHPVTSLERNVADAQSAIVTRLVYAGPCEIAWPDPPLSPTE
jgi:hypothetical protein